jgi:hypothetical protein
VATLIGLDIEIIDNTKRHKSLQDRQKASKLATRQKKQQKQRLLRMKRIFLGKRTLIE